MRLPPNPCMAALLQLRHLHASSATARRLHPRLQACRRAHLQAFQGSGGNEPGSEAFILGQGLMDVSSGDSGGGKPLMPLDGGDPKQWRRSVTASLPSHVAPACSATRSSHWSCRCRGMNRWTACRETRCAACCCIVLAAG